jgi:hypothetical protein
MPVQPSNHGRPHRRNLQENGEDGRRRVFGPGRGERKRRASSEPSGRLVREGEEPNQEAGEQRLSLASSSRIISQVSFGSVRVHGSNPSATGIPVEFVWEVEESEEFDVDDFEKDSPDHELHRIATKSREIIAQQHHSQDSIVRFEKEMRGASNILEKNQNTMVLECGNIHIIAVRRKAFFLLGLIESRNPRCGWY